jgi:hypothetical protein
MRGSNVKDRVWTVEGKIVAAQESSQDQHVTLTVEVPAGAWLRWGNDHGSLARHYGGQRVRITAQTSLGVASHDEPTGESGETIVNETRANAIRELLGGQGVPQADVQRGGGEEPRASDGAVRPVCAVYRPQRQGHRSGGRSWGVPDPHLERIAGGLAGDFTTVAGISPEAPQR